MTPRDVRRRYSKGRVLLVVLRKGYRKSGTWAASQRVCLEDKITIKEEASSVGVTRDALKQRESITNPIRSVRSKGRRRKSGIDIDDLQQQR